MLVLAACGNATDDTDTTEPRTSLATATTTTTTATTTTTSLATDDDGARGARDPLGVTMSREDLAAIEPQLEDLIEGLSFQL